MTVVIKARRLLRRLPKSLRAALRKKIPITSPRRAPVKRRPDLHSR
jgi:hypothetical protein